MADLTVPRDILVQRVERLQAAMESEKLDGVVLGSPSNITYFTGYLETVRPYERPVATVVTRSGEATMILNEVGTNQLRANLSRGTVRDADFRFYTEHPRVDSRLPTVTQWSSMLASILREKGLTGAVGCDSINSLINQAASEARVSMVPVGGLVMGFRLVKDEYELAIMRASGQVADKAQEYYHSLLAPGKLIAEVNYETARYLAVQLAEAYPEDQWKPQVSGWTGVDSACPHGPNAFSGRRIQAGDSVINIINYPFNGYWVENERTYIIGEPSETQECAFTAVYNAQQAGYRQFVDGKRVADIDGAAQRVIENAGLGRYINHRASHGKGLETHEMPLDTGYNVMALQAGMVLSCEPGVYIPDVGGFRHSDDVIVGAECGEWLTHYPRDLETLTIRA